AWVRVLPCDGLGRLDGCRSFHHSNRLKCTRSHQQTRVGTHLEVGRAYLFQCQGTFLLTCRDRVEDPNRCIGLEADRIAVIPFSHRHQVTLDDLCQHGGFVVGDTCVCCNQRQQGFTLFFIPLRPQS